ncbi:helix-turn-helix transcriptional regulator [Pseudonocardia humida]|uniref:AAA family ATPase n=1 Tax=Pseudonocardia humida TaxID=2800819 RepID=A0ABT1AC02_9PSEU|nr:LuxR family transcriptional regulator [Pseudonocardia humida]MCO1660468.1 AAA family ATPase [Pseudonocardia humida]
MGLLGRAEECALLDALVDDVRRGASRALVLRGEAGIGKTALLGHLAESAADLTVVRAVGVESEMELAFAGLHQLCAPLLGRLEQLPGPQRDALGIVFGLRTGPAPERFLVALAVLSLLSEVAEHRPLLCVVDDAQWLDRTSALTLAFVARRLLAEPVGLVFAAREPGAELGHLPDLDVRGLRDDDARALLSSAVRFALDRPVRDRILAETRGNPLALLELPRGLTPTQLAGGFGLPTTRDLPRRIETSYIRRLEALPDDARRLMLVAAAEPVGDPLLLQRACDRLGIALSAVDATDGLLELGVRVTFRHPLARSAAYRSAGGSERRAAHLALAAVTSRDVDPDRRAWHLAAAAPGPDEEVARELERSASRAQARGGLASAAALLQRSVVLTADPALRAGRALAAARAGLGAGAFDVSRELLAAAEAGPLDESGRARVDLLRAGIAFARNRGGDAPVLLLEAARKLAALDVRLSRDAYLDAWAAGLFAGRLAAAGGNLLDISRAVATAPRPVGPPLPCDLLLDGLALVFTAGHSVAAPVLGRAVAAFAGAEVSAAELLRWGWLATRAANLVWDYDRGLQIGTRAARLARDSGALDVLAAADNALGQAAVFGGDFAGAALLASEVDAVKAATGSRIGPYAAIALAGFRGRQAGAAALISGVIAEATAGGQGTAVQYAQWANSVLMNGLGRYDEALASAVEASEQVPELFVTSWALSELVEAASRTGHAEVARDALARLGEQRAASDTGWAAGVHVRSRALLSEGAAAEHLYRQAIDLLGRTRLRPELARAHLLYGEWLRRASRRVDARAPLHAAHASFVRIGMEAFAERARGELRATGAKVRKRVVETREDLTAQEMQVARLARDGLSNPEIGARLFLSPRTVEWHLRKVFAKLGIHSRQELARALPGSDSELVPA